MPSDAIVIKEESAEQEGPVDSIFSPMLLSPKLKGLDIAQMEK